WPSAASPTTSMSGSALSSAFRPARSTAWSSASSTRIRGACAGRSPLSTGDGLTTAMSEHHVVERDARQDVRAGARIALDAELAVHQRQPLLHSEQAQSAFPRTHHFDHVEAD